RVDAEFKHALAGMASDLRTTLQTESDPAAIDNSVDTTRTALQERIQELERERDAVQAELDPILTLVHTGWVAPRPILDVLAAQIGELARAQQLLNRYDVGRAGEVVGAVRGAIVKELVNVVP